ncbi:MAG: patatin-like phospholipase family protein [Gammaproteobacteria bacterium]
MRKIKQLVFEGGGVKGIAYAGALRVLHEKGLLGDVEHVAGSSVGSIVALAVSLGYSVDEIDELLDMNFSALQDGPSFLKTRKAAAFLSHWGVHPGKALHTMLSNWVVKQLGNKKATFADLHTRVLAQGAKGGENRYRELYAYTTDLTTRRPMLLSYHTTPDMPIVEAVRASSALPGFFYPSKSIINGETHYWVDGGLIRNYPIRLFDTQYPNGETLGFRLDSAEEIEELMGGKAAPSQPLDNLMHYITSLMDSAMFAQHQYQEKENYRTVYIDTLDVKTTEFELSPAKKAALIASGRQATERFLARWSSEQQQKSTRPLALERHERLAKHDRYKLYQQARGVHLTPLVEDSETGEIQWLLLSPVGLSDWVWQQKVNRYVERLKHQGDLIHLTLGRLVAGFEYHGTPCLGWVVQATVSARLIEEGNRWLEKYGDNVERLEQPIDASQYVVQQRLAHQRYPQWMLRPPAAVAEQQRIMDAVDNGEYNVVLNYVAQGGAVTFQDQVREDYLLHKAAYRLDERLVGLLANRPDALRTLNGVNRFGDTPLHSALFHKPPSQAEEVKAVVSLLLQAGTKANVANKDGQTALMFAVENGMVEVVQRLLQQGADPQRTDNTGRRAWDYMVEQDREKFSEALVAQLEPPAVVAAPGVSV